MNKIHHTAIICSNYEISKKFYTHVLGLEIIREVYRQERQSYKLDLALNGDYIIELFSFPNPQIDLQGQKHVVYGTWLLK